MPRTRTEKVNCLFDAIGFLDDRAVQQAMEYRPFKRRTASSAFLRVGALAACLALVIGIGVLIEQLLPKPSLSPEEHYPTADSATASLDAVFRSKIESGRCVMLSSTQAKELMRDGSYYLVWEDVQTKQLYASAPLTEYQMRQLQAQMGKGEAIKPDQPAPFYRVWMVFGDGSVCSPYLKTSDGNVSYMTLFDYDAEIYPSQDFISCVSQILG